MQTKPVAVPAIGQGAFANTTREEPGTSLRDPLPTVDQVLARYYQAIGGQAAAQKITTRVIKLSWLRPKLVNGGTPNAAMIARGETWAMAIYQKAPNKYLAVINSPNGIIYQGFDGTTGWIKTPQGQTVLTRTALGLDPEQTDFKDYADVDGVKLPFITIVSYLDDSHLGTTRRYIEVKQNVPIDDQKFEVPQN